MAAPADKHEYLTCERGNTCKGRSSNNLADNQDWGISVWNLGFRDKSGKEASQRFTHAASPPTPTCTPTNHCQPAFKLIRTCKGMRAQSTLFSIWLFGRDSVEDCSLVGLRLEDWAYRPTMRVSSYHAEQNLRL